MHDFSSTASLTTLQTRAALLRRTREFFDQHGFMEVQTPVLSADTVVDRHLDPLHVTLPADPFRPGVGRAMFLQTSPEFSMKRLLASGARAIYEITPAFRVGEFGQLHNPEFTMLEWYRCGDTMSAAIDFLSQFVSELLDRPSAVVTTMTAAFLRHAGFHPMNCTGKQILLHCRQSQVPIPDSIDAGDWDACFDLAFAELVQPRLGREIPEIVHEYPASQAALAQVCPGNPPHAERFELFVDGIELANGYHELLDAKELIRRNERVNQQRVQDGKSALPVQSRLVEAMQSGLPPCCGVALGFDRLVMLAVGAECLSDVLCFPVDRA